MSKTKTKYQKLKNYPENTDIIVQYAYDNQLPKAYGGQAVADSRYVNVLVQHSLIAMPENDFEARRDDPRVGYFTTRVNDMTTTCLLYTSPSPRDLSTSRMPSSA